MDDTDWEEMKEKAAGLIRLCISDEGLHSLRMQEGSDLQQHINVFQNIYSHRSDDACGSNG
ncbi:hypothetical protein A2U01_0005122 [Trifolium medium]|uniref:Uncharacterized protein n=1 Tax=Trifolium medium TaxID=97028 RepID=A0A392MAI9_9FABA|nr:hypothetical protein [Trifolium medium]